MATTTKTVTPIEAAGGVAGTAAAALMTLPCDPSQAFAHGDCIAVDSTTRDAGVDNDVADASADNLVLGFAQTNGFTSNSTIDRDGIIGEDQINIALAVPGARFQGNVCNAAGTDETGEYVANVRMPMGIVEADTDGIAALGQTGTVAFTLEYVNPQYDITNSVWKYGHSAGVGILNPRVMFVVYASATIFSYYTNA